MVVDQRCIKIYAMVQCGWSFSEKKPDVNYMGTVDLQSPICHFIYHNIGYVNSFGRIMIFTINIIGNRQVFMLWLLQ